MSSAPSSAEPRSRPRVMLLGYGGRDDIEGAAERFRPFIQQHAELVLDDLTFSKPTDGVEADFAVVLGGDGSILRSALHLGYRQVPVIGVNLGRLGFLADLPPDDFFDAFPKICAGEYRLIDHLMFECQVFRNNQLESTHLGLNETALLAGEPFGILDVHLYVDDELVTTYSCDGLIVSTPVGSTAHSLSAGGPILRKDLEAVVICPISPHTLTNRPVVDSARRTYELEVPRPNEGTTLVVDGRAICRVESEMRIRVRRAEAVFQLVEVPNRSYYRTLREKLGWGWKVRRRLTRKSPLAVSRVKATPTQGTPPVGLRGDIRRKLRRMDKLIVGCGYLGLRVARRWRDAGHRVLAVTRSADRARQFEDEGLTALLADVTLPETLDELPAVATVLYAVGFDRDGGASMRQVYTDGLGAVLDALPPPERLLYIGSTGVYGDFGGGWVDEDSPCEPTRAGGLVCLEAEELLRAHPIGHRAVVLRLAGIYGPGRIPMRAKLLAGEPLPVASGGHLNLIHVDDAVSVVLAAEQAASPQTTYLVCDGHPVVRSEYYERLAQLLDTAPPQFTPPPPGSPVAQRSGADKRISNDRMLKDLPVTLDYPNFRAGLAAIISQERAE